MLGYILVMVVGIAVSGVAALWVGSSYSKYSRQTSNSGLTGAQTARTILGCNGLSNVKVEPVAGTLTDHYSPRTGGPTRSGRPSTCCGSRCCWARSGTPTCTSHGRRLPCRKRSWRRPPACSRPSADCSGTGRVTRGTATRREPRRPSRSADSRATKVDRGGSHRPPDGHTSQGSRVGPSFSSVTSWTRLSATSCCYHALRWRDWSTCPRACWERRCTTRPESIVLLAETDVVQTSV